MLINLKASSLKEEPLTVKLELHERLPAHVIPTCLVNCQYKVKAFEDYYLLTLDVDAMLTILCQRCLDKFVHHYTNQTVLAICYTDEMAEKMLDSYESIVSSNDRVDLTELLTDELHLYAPEFHLGGDECNKEASKFIDY